MRLRAKVLAAAPQAKLGWLWVLIVSGMLSATVVLTSPLLAVGVLGGLAALILIAMVPELGLILTVGTIPLEEMGVLWQDALGFRLSLSKAFGAITLAVWVARVLLRGERIWVPKTALFLGAYILAGVVSLVDAVDLPAGLAMVVRLLTTLAFVVLVANMLDTWPKLVRALAAFLLVAVLISGFAVAQQFFPSLIYEQKSAQQHEKEITFGAMKSVVEKELLGEATLRSGGATWHPIVLGFDSVLLVPVFIFLLFSARAPPWRALAAGALVVQLAALMASGSRSSALTLAVIGVILVVKRLVPINRFTIAAVLLGLVVGWFAAPESFRERVLNVEAYSADRSASLHYRLDMFQAGAEVVRRAPINGVGLGNLTEMNNYLKEWDFAGYRMGVHNMYLQVALETGIIGLTAMLLFFGYTLHGFGLAAAKWEQAGAPLQRNLCLALGVCVWVVLVQGASLDLMATSMKNAWFLMALQPVLLRLAEQRLQRADGLTS